MTDQKVNAPVKRAAIKRLSFWESIDLPLAVIVVSLFAIGLLMIYSASWQLASSLGNSEYRMVLRQIVDEVMYEIRNLSGQTYVDSYATKPSKPVAAPAEPAVPTAPAAAAVPLPSPASA